MHGPKRVTAARKCLCLRSLDRIKENKKGQRSFDPLERLYNTKWGQGDFPRYWMYTVVIDRGAWKGSKVRRVVG